eukprot:m.913469 g.913469  ORF g.913469 m.913469 type:complete len:75 (-) comp23727_c0_seq58:4749-4973(-)
MHHTGIKANSQAVAQACAHLTRMPATSWVYDHETSMCIPEDLHIMHSSVGESAGLQGGVMKTVDEPPQFNTEAH